jgi:oligopeptide/dipeptide ABC transporter ATP-binding protein
MRVPPRDWREIFERPAHPYAPALISAIPDPLRRAPLATTGGDLPNPLSPPDGCAFSPRCRYAEAEGDLSERCRYFALGPITGMKATPAFSDRSTIDVDHREAAWWQAVRGTAALSVFQLGRSELGQQAPS